MLLKVRIKYYAVIVRYHCLNLVLRKILFLWCRLPKGKDASVMEFFLRPDLDYPRAKWGGT